MKKISFVLFILALATLFTVSLSAINVNDAFEAQMFTTGDTTLPYRIYVPENYDSNAKYPLIVFLHGAGECGDDNSAQLKNAVQILFDRDDGLAKTAIFVAPQCPADNQWVDTPWADGNYSVDAVPESNELAAVVKLVEKLENDYSIDTNKVYAMGLSMGGFGVWDLLMRHNDIFAAGIPMCGGADVSKAELLAKTPIYTFHGTADTSVPYSGTSEMVEAIENVDGRYVTFISYEGDSHGIWDKASAEDGLLEWLFAQNLTDRYPEKATETLPVTVGSESLVTDSDTDSGAEVSETVKEDHVTTNTSEKIDNGEKNGNTILIIGIAAAAVVVIVAIVTIALLTSKKKK